MSQHVPAEGNAARREEPAARATAGWVTSTWHWSTLLLAILLSYFALAHSFEDFAHAVPSERFNVDETPAAILLAGAFVLQGLVIFAVWQRRWPGYLGTFAVGVAWLAAVLLDHTGDLLDETFRTVTSDILIAAVLITSLLLVITSAGAIRARRSEEQSRRAERSGAKP